MGVNISNEFHRTSTNPIDDSLTLSKTEMLNRDDNLMPSKYFTICTDDGCIYLYDKFATPNSTTGKFTKFEGGSGAVKDGNIDFGGSDRDAYGYGAKEGLSPCDTLFTEIGGNRFAFMPASLITVEYSRDGGSTWTDYGSSDNAKKALFTLNSATSFTIGKADSTNKATTSANYNKYMLRVTINTNGTTCYARFKKFILNISTNGSSGSCCDFQGALQGSPTTFTTIKSGVTLSGWSGYNVINLDTAVTTYGNRSDQYQYLRWVFRTTAAGDTSYNGLMVCSIKGFADTAWNVPSTMARTGHLYSYDENGTATFPGNVIMKDIYYAGTKATCRMIQFIDNTNDTYGNGIAIGGGGQTIIGGGESASVAAANLGNAGSEVMYITNDNGKISFVPNTDSGWANIKESYFDANGDLYVNRYINAVGGTFTAVSTDTPLRVQGNHASQTYIQYKNSSGTSMGYIGVRANDNSVYRPYFYDSSAKEITLKDEIVSGGYVPMPYGGTYTCSTNSITGALKIKLPVKYTSHMLSFWVDIYDYSEGTAVSYFVSGYNYSVDNKWYNESANCIGKGSYSNLNVRFGDDGTNTCVIIGETNTTWHYPQVVVRDFYHGYSTINSNFVKNWGVSFISTLPSNISQTIRTNTYVATNTVSSNNNTASWGSAVTVGSVGGVDLKFTMPSNPNTNTTYSLSRDGASVKLTPSSGTAQTVSLNDLINGLSTDDSNADSADYLVAQYAGGGSSSTTYHRRPVSKVVNANVVKSALGTGTGTTKFLREDGTWRTPAYPTVPTKTSQLTNDSNFISSIPAASSSVRGGAKIYASGDTLYITTT